MQKENLTLLLTSRIFFDCIMVVGEYDDDIYLRDTTQHKLPHCVDEQISENVTVDNTRSE